MVVSKISKHYKNKRYKREKIINECLNGDGNVIDSFIVNRGHKNGVERHEITDNGIVLIYNASSNLLVSKLIARKGQIEKYYNDAGRKPPEFLIGLARYHQDLGYNK